MTLLALLLYADFVSREGIKVDEYCSSKELAGYC